MADEDTIVSRIIARHGETINLRESPQVAIDIIRNFRWQLDDDPDGGVLPGGVPPAPPPPGPAETRFSDEPTNTEILREVLKLSKQVSTLQKQLGS